MKKEETKKKRLDGRRGKVRFQSCRVRWEAGVFVCDRESIDECENAHAEGGGLRASWRKGGGKEE